MKFFFALLMLPTISLADAIPVNSLAEIHVSWKYEEPAHLYETVIIHVEYEGTPFEEIYVPATTTFWEYTPPNKGEYCFSLSAIDVNGELTSRGNVRGCADWDGKAPLPPLLQLRVK